jgi:hypothetical protein
MDQRLKKLEDKMSGRELTDEEKLKYRKEEKEVRMCSTSAAFACPSQIQILSGYQ